MGEGLEQWGKELAERSSLHDQLSVTMVRSSQLCEICSWLCMPRSWLTSRVFRLSAHSSLRSWETRGVSRGPAEAVAGEGLPTWAEDAAAARGLKLPEE